ncbi:sigma-70 family RNA polymerase sigma factor [Myxococcota bacterium]|nr:sigma-70 family RNA polymerase sigma factor [Myxococcota bacterium]
MGVGLADVHEPTRLVEAARRGDVAAARALAERLSPVIHARVRRVLLRAGRASAGRIDATDLASGVWLALIDKDWKKLRAWDPSLGASFEGYVGLLAEREALNHMESERAQKRGGRERHVDGDAADLVAAPSGTPEDQTIAQDLAVALERHLLQSLSERGRAVLRFLYADAMAPDDVARTLGVDKQVVYNWQHKIRETARTFLGTRTS